MSDFLSIMLKCALLTFVLAFVIYIAASILSKKPGFFANMGKKALEKKQKASKKMPLKAAIQSIEKKQMLKTVFIVSPMIFVKIFFLLLMGIVFIGPIAFLVGILSTPGIFENMDDPRRNLVRLCGASASFTQSIPSILATSFGFALGFQVFIKKMAFKDVIVAESNTLIFVVISMIVFSIITALIESYYSIKLGIKL